MQMAFSLIMPNRFKKAFDLGVCFAYIKACKCEIVAVVAKRLRHLVVVQAYGGSIPLDRPTFYSFNDPLASK